MKPNRAIILAAGRGSRMESATIDKPKCLTLFEGKTLLDWQISALREANVNSVAVVKGYKSELITQGDEHYVNPRWFETNMVYSLFCANDYLGDTIISYSDIVYSKSHIIQLLNNENDFCITADLEWRSLWESRFENPLSDAESFKTENNVLIEIGARASDIDDIEAQYMGLIKLNAQGWQKAKQIFYSLDEYTRDRIDMTSFLALLIACNIKIAVEFICGKWLEIDTQSDINIYDNLLKDGTWKHNWRK
jgi:L-glutamine-phosphate cytidylyltransferase